jgi:hypothetical protein
VPIAVEEVERALERLFIAAEGATLRREDKKKAREVAALLSELERVKRGGTLVDAAAGHAYVGILAAALGHFSRVFAIERDPARGARLAAIAKASSLPVELRLGDVGDPALWPDAPDAVVALHACGAASDGVIDAASRARARWLFVVPCCYSEGVPFAARAEAHGEALGLPRAAAVRRRFVESLIDAERTLRLEAAGYEVTALALVAPTVTPHNLLLRARRSDEPTRAEAARARLQRLHTPT